MSFFQHKKPRGFQHRFLYVDERKQRLEAAIQRVKAKMNTENTVSDTVDKSLYNACQPINFARKSTKRAIFQFPFVVLLSIVFLVFVFFWYCRGKENVALFIE